MVDQNLTEDEQVAPKSFWGRMKDTWDLLAPIYKDAIKHDRKGFLKPCLAKLGIASVWGAITPWVGGYAMNAIAAAVEGGIMTAGALVGPLMEQATNALGSILDGYQGTTQREYNYSTKRHRGLERAKEAANIPESARGEKDPKELSDYALQNAECEANLLSKTTDLAFYLPTLCFGITQAFIRNPAIGLAAMTAIGINSYVAYYNAHKNQPDNADFIRSDTRFKARNMDVMAHSSRVKALGRQKEEYETLKDLEKEAEKSNARLARRERKSNFLQACVRLVAEAGLGVWAAYYAIKTGDIGAVRVLATATAVAMFAGSRTIKAIGEIREELGKWHSTNQSLSYDHRVHHLTHGDKTLDHVQGKLTLRGVSYTYPDGTPALKNINLSFGNGLTVITGPSGGGKSTLLALLQHRLEGEGQILLDGVPLTELAEGFLESQITAVSQRPDFFEQRSVEENLDSVRSGLTEKDRREALQRVGLYKEIGRAGVSKRLSHLSGGQQQRENLAEAILRDTTIIFYDEPTANLNQLNRRRVWSKMLDMSQDHTIIVVSHNAQEIESADRVVTIEDGRVTQDGTPAELANQRGYVKELLKDARRPLRTSPENKAMLKLAQLKQEALMGLKSKKKKDIRRQYKHVLGPGLAQSLMEATTITDVDENAIRARIAAFKERRARRG